MRIKGSNQYQSKFGLSKDAIISIWAVAFFTLAGINVANVLHKVTSPCPDTGCNAHLIKTVYAKEPKTELQEITEYIIKLWEQKYGRKEAVKALACFISESGLRSDAYNFNSNGTWDYGVAQWNQVHGQSIEELKGNWKKQLDLAFSLYEQRGWKPWYGKGCK